jgi:hypothetical protein
MMQTELDLLANTSHVQPNNSVVESKAVGNQMMMHAVD